MDTELKIDDDKVIAHIVKNTDLLTKFIASLTETHRFDYRGFLDFCTEELSEAEQVFQLEANNSHGTFDIHIYEYQGISFVRAIDINERGYFLDINDAKDEADELESFWQDLDNDAY